MPHPAVVVERHDGLAAQICAEKAADLVRQQRKPEQRGQIARAEQPSGQCRGGRYRGQPGQPQSGVVNLKIHIGSRHAHVSGNHDVSDALENLKT